MAIIITKKEEVAIGNLILVAESYGLVNKMAVDEKKIIANLKRKLSKG